MPGPRAFVVREQAWAFEFDLRPLLLTDTVIEEMDPESVRAKHTASFGLAALKRIDLVVDGKHDVAYIHAKRIPPAPIKHNRLGATFPPHDPESDSLIAHVALGSPAYEAGVRSGDELLKMGEQDMTQWRALTNPPGSYSEQPAGTRIELTLRRSNETFRATATLRDILPPKPNAPGTKDK
jgi:S1-C subfamily serine protease